jgi:hypothetical protein
MKIVYKASNEKQMLSMAISAIERLEKKRDLGTMTMDEESEFIQWIEIAEMYLYN